MAGQIAGESGLRRSPIHQRHVALGARFAEFAGWSMPLEYAGGGVVAEHRAVREQAGLFDVSHLGKVIVRGPGAVRYLNRCLTSDLDRIGPGQAQYSLVCNEQGGIVDDLIGYVRSPDAAMLIPNAANSAEVVRRLRAAAPADVEILDRHVELAVLAVQGPAADEVLADAGLPHGHPYLSFRDIQVGGAEVMVARTGYTGERGYELVALAEAARPLWDALIAAGARHGLRPAGLGARDTLRTEMGYALHGQDITPEVSPVQARLGWAVGWSKPEFWGRDALRTEKAAGPSRVLWGLRAAGRAIPRPGMRVLRASSPDDAPSPNPPRQVGVVTSGTFSPTLRTGVGLCLLDAGVAVGQLVEVEVRRRREPFVVTKPPFLAPALRG